MKDNGIVWWSGEEPQTPDRSVFTELNRATVDRARRFERVNPGIYWIAHNVPSINETNPSYEEEINDLWEALKIIFAVAKKRDKCGNTLKSIITEGIDWKSKCFEQPAEAFSCQFLVEKILDYFKIEYIYQPRCTKGTPDYHVELSKDKRVFIEAKGLKGLDDEAKLQLQNYVKNATCKSVPFAVLTDGLQWLFYKCNSSRDLVCAESVLLYDAFYETHKKHLLPGTEIQLRKLLEYMKQIQGKPYETS